MFCSTLSIERENGKLNRRVAIVASVNPLQSAANVTPNTYTPPKRCIQLTFIISYNAPFTISTSITQLPAFGKFSVDMQLDNINFATAVVAIKSNAPTWFKLLHSLLQNTRQSRLSYPTPNNWTAVDRRLFVVTSMICFSRARKSSNVLASCLDVYLVGSGVPRRVIETLAGLGLCHSYHNANTLMKAVASYAEVRSPS